VTLAPSYTKGPPVAQTGSGGHRDGCDQPWGTVGAPAAIHVEGPRAGSGDMEVPIPPPLPALRTFSDELAHIGRLLGLLLHQRLDLLHEVAYLLRDTRRRLPLHPGHTAAISNAAPLSPCQGQGQDKLSPGAGDKAQGWTKSSQHITPSEPLGMTYPNPSPQGPMGSKVLPSSSLFQPQHQKTSLAAAPWPWPLAQTPWRERGTSHRSPVSGRLGHQLGRALTSVSLAVFLVSPLRVSMCPAVRRTTTSGAGQGSGWDANASSPSHPATASSLVQHHSPGPRRGCRRHRS